MRLSSEQVSSLKVILKEHCGLDYTDEQAQEAGLAIMRFVAVKSRREQELTHNKEVSNEQVSGNYGVITK